MTTLLIILLLLVYAVFQIYRTVKLMLIFEFWEYFEDERAFKYSLFRLWMPCYKNYFGLKTPESEDYE